MPLLRIFYNSIILMKSKKLVLWLTFVTWLFHLSSCSRPSHLGEWQVEMVFTASDNTSSRERLTLRFDEDGKIYKNGKHYGLYKRLSRKRIKFFSHDRKLVFYGQFTRRGTIEGQGLHIPNDQIFASWTARRR